jgi:hypothetical protein
VRHDRCSLLSDRNSFTRIQTMYIDIYIVGYYDTMSLLVTF